MGPASSDCVTELFLESCQSNDVNKARQTLLLGADVNWRREDSGYAGLHYAAGRGNGELLELLLNQTGVNVNITKNKNWTPLMVACYWGHDNIVRKLCRAPGIELNLVAQNGDTALNIAVYENRLQCVEVLRTARDVDWNVRSKSGDSPLSMAVEFGLSEILLTILSVSEPHLDLSVTNRDGKHLEDIARSVFNHF